MANAYLAVRCVLHGSCTCMAMVPHHLSFDSDVSMQVERLLADNDCGAGSGEDGPMTELFFWRQRMAKFNSVTQQVPFLQVIVLLIRNVLFCAHIPIKGRVNCIACAVANRGPLHRQIWLDCSSQRFVYHTRLGSLTLRHWTLCLTHETCQYAIRAQLYSSFGQCLHPSSFVVLELACSFLISEMAWS